MKKQVDIWDKEYKSSKDKWKKDNVQFPDFIKDKNVIELGSGNGKSINSINKQNPKKLVGIDFSEEAIKLCKKNFEGEFYVKNILDLKYKNEFDVVLCRYVLNNMIEEERIKVVKSIKDALDENGVVLFEDFAIRDFRMKGNEIEKNTYEKKNGLICHFFEEDEVKRLFNNFNIKNLEIKESFPLRARNEKRRIIYGIFKVKK
jgi:SAM-dependent methyltransferase